MTKDVRQRIEQLRTELRRHDHVRVDDRDPRGSPRMSTDFAVGRPGANDRPVDADEQTAQALTEGQALIFVDSES